jgi:hypothetical protein
MLDGTPEDYAPPGGNSGYLKENHHILQFAFLVDDEGRVHVTVGTTKQLSKVSGSPLR